MITIKDIDVLTIDEFHNSSSYIKSLRSSWWIIGNVHDIIGCVSVDGETALFPVIADTSSIHVRPALTVSIDEEGLVLLMGSKIDLFGMKWTMVGERDGYVRVLCDEFIGHHRYHSECVPWKESELKVWLEEWLSYVAMGMDDVKLASKRVPGEVYRVGKYDMILLKEIDGECYMLAKDFYGEPTVFDKSSNKYKDSHVDKICKKFTEEIEAIVGSDNIIEHSVDYTSSDGSKKYEPIKRKASLLTLDMFKEYEDILKEHNPEKWWWLATPWKDTEWRVSCVSPGGNIIYINFDYNDGGVRPFCVLKSSVLDDCE